MLKSDLLKVGHKLLNAQIISQTEKLDINTFNVWHPNIKLKDNIAQSTIYK